MAFYYGTQAAFVSEEMVRAYKVAEDSFVIRKYDKALKKLGYGEPDIISSFGWSDNNNFCLHGIEGVVLFNAMNNVHMVSEYFYLDELVKSIEIVLELAVHFLSLLCDLLSAILKSRKTV